MNVVIIFNGLGNQMSQYAFFLRKKSIDPSTICIYDKRTSEQHFGFELKRAFNINCNNYGFKYKMLYFLYSTSFLQRRPISKLLSLIGIRFIVERKDGYYVEANLLNRRGINFYYAGWHSEKYFLPIEEEIIRTFKFNIDNKNNTPQFKFYENEIKQNNNSVSIHIRRGDYLTTGGYYQFTGVATLEYYQKAIAYIESKIDNPQYFVFSDDLNWCKENLTLCSATFVDCNTGENSWKDMYLMSVCKHNINANSTFSWWAAWLNPNKNKITIVPKEFIRNVIPKDFYPENWVKI
ncbi:MAG: alpha-1,2-fucosyltransferase [Candidatus Symbiothrix sp.]|jgi:hypothetical protein|nr:alpha-1,2-fucosyltransferase [Candidatus Symbiothrix sp.]